MQKLYFQSYDGCYANASEGQVILGYFRENGWQQVERVEDADLVVYNTCAFDRGAEDRSMETVRALRARVDADAKLLVTGCLPGINPARLQAAFGGATLTPKSLDALDRLYPGVRPLASIRNVHAGASGPCTIRVAAGCLGSCTFCGIRNAIGTVRSRPPQEIVREFEAQYALGHRSFVFASHDFGAYGQDLGSSAVELLQALPARARDYRVYIEWIDPRWLSKMLDGFVALMNEGRLAKDFFVSLQSGNDRVLRLMRRHYTAAEVRRCLDTLFARVPDFRPQVEFIAGFPTETEAEFDDTLALVESYLFRNVQVYKFDAKPGTEAARLPGALPAQVIDARHDRALRMIARSRGRFRLTRFSTAHRLVRRLPPALRRRMQPLVWRWLDLQLALYHRLPTGMRRRLAGLAAGR